MRVGKLRISVFLAECRCTGAFEREKSLAGWVRSDRFFGKVAVQFMDRL